MTDFNVPTTIETLLVRFIASQARQWNAMGESLARIESRVANVEAELLQVIIEQRRAQQQPEPAVQEPQEPIPKSDSLAIIESRVANVEAEMRQVIEQLTSVEEPPEPTIQESEAELLAAFEENVANQISTATLGMPLVNYSESNIPSSNVSQAGTDIEEQEEEINPIYRPMTIFEDTCKLYKFERDTGFSNFDTAGRYQIQIVTLDRNGNTAYVLLRHPEQEEQKFLIAQRDKATPRQDRGLCCVLTCDDTAKTFLVIFTSVTVARQFIEVYNRVAKA